jgi:FHA domain-containing protein
MTLADPSTTIDPQDRTSWYIDDAVARLRLWGTEYSHPLPEPPVPLKLGSAPSCQVRLHDKAGRLSREHAMLVPEPTGWAIQDLGSKNGLWVDGSRVTSKATLHAGVRIQLGRVTLVVESHQFIGLRSLVCRLLGWAPTCQADVDEALQSLRNCAMQRTPLVLIGGGDLAPVAARLHRMTLGPDTPFLTDDGGDLDATIRGAMHGTLCLSTQGRAHASAIADAVRAVELTARPRLVLCASKASDVAGLGAKPGQLAVIAIPPLSARTEEILRIVHEAAQDLVHEMGVHSSGFTMHDLERLQVIKFDGMADLEGTIRRVIAMRIWGVTEGAKKLGLKHSSLSLWTRSKNRKLST